MMDSFRRRKLLEMMNVYADRMMGEGVTGEDACILHMFKVQSERDFEKKIRSLQTLLDLRQPEAITCALKELYLASARWPSKKNAYKESEFLLRLLYAHLPRAEWDAEA